MYLFNLKELNHYLQKRETRKGMIHTAKVFLSTMFHVSAEWEMDTCCPFGQSQLMHAMERQLTSSMLTIISSTLLQHGTKVGCTGIRKSTSVEHISLLEMPQRYTVGETTTTM